MNIINNFEKKFRNNELLLYESKYWIWSLRPVQSTLGAGILSLKRECSALSELNHDEFSDLTNIIKIIEKTLKVSFKYDVINYLMLMMVDKQVHYHVLPRYRKPIFFAGLIWEDSGWPGIPILSGKEIDSKNLYEIQEKIKSFIF
jgi:diadenosine tetraphosphate (Ap4A) HIT family hydrolase